MSSADQYRCARATARALIDIPAPAPASCSTGADRRNYLQGLLTNDIVALTAGTGCYAAYLTAQGRMIADMRVFELGDALLWISRRRSARRSAANGRCSSSARMSASKTGRSRWRVRQCLDLGPGSYSHGILADADAGISLPRHDGLIPCRSMRTPGSRSKTRR